MNTDMTWQTESTSSAATEQLGERLGAKLRGGEVVELVSDVGGGKTTFTRGLVRGAGSSDKVGSPTFTIAREYQTPQFTVYHFDFYRLGEAGIVADEIAEVVQDPQAVTVVEWGDIVHDVLPEARLRIEIAQTAEGNRTVLYRYPETLEYLFEGQQT
jgi:tRNA threonylcarbamoyladenosine biosynthesis protein TsaE